MIIKIRNSYINIDKSLATETTNLGKERIGGKGGSQRQSMSWYLIEGSLTT